MSRIQIVGPETFVEELIKNWDSIKPYLSSGKSISIIRGKYLKADAYLTIDEDEIVIICDSPTHETIKSLISLAKAQSAIRSSYREIINAIIKIHTGQLSKLVNYSDFESFIRDYGKFMEEFLKALIISLEKTLALDVLSADEKKALENVKHINDPLSEEVVQFDKLSSYLVVLDNLWRKKLGWKIPKFAFDKGVDVEGLESMFDKFLRAVQSQDFTTLRGAAEALTHFTLGLFGVKIKKKKDAKGSKAPPYIA